MINLGYEDVNRQKNFTLAYLIPSQYEPLFEGNEGTDNENGMICISTTVSEPEVKVLPAMPINSKMIFPEIIHQSETYTARCSIVKGH